jgi:hypothetical protein
MINNCCPYLFRRAEQNVKCFRSRPLDSCSAYKVEARVGIEPTHKGFADPSLTAWVPRHLEHCTPGQNFVDATWHFHESSRFPVSSMVLSALCCLQMSKTRLRSLFGFRTG